MTWDGGFQQSNSGCNLFRHPGFAVGFIGGFTMVFVHLAILFFNVGTNRGDWLALGLGLIVYFLAGRSGAQRQANVNAQGPGQDPVAGVRGAAVGAALVTYVFVWAFIILRSVYRDALGITVLVDPIGLCVVLFVDGLLAMGLGAWAGRTVANKYRTYSSW